MFYTRHVSYPTVAQIKTIEGINIIDLPAPGSIAGVGTGRVAVVGEFLKGGYTPYRVMTGGELKDIYGDYSDKIGDSDGEGNGYLQLKNKKFSELVICRVDLRCRTTDGELSPLTITRDSGASGELLVPAGTVVTNSDGTFKVITSEDLFFDEDEVGESNAKTVHCVKILGSSNAGQNTLTVFETDPEEDITVTNSKMIDYDAVNIDSQYSEAIDKLLGSDHIVSKISIVYSARASQTINAKLRSHVLEASKYGRGRIACIRPVFGYSKTDALGDSDFGVQVNADERVIYCYPQVQTYVPELGKNVDVGWDGYVASILSNLPSERNPGEETEFAKEILNTITGFESGAPSLTRADYEAFKASGIAAPKWNSVLACYILQSGITSSKTEISRRRMADEIQDSIGEYASRYCKLPPTKANRDALEIAINEYLEALKSENNPVSQRIKDYLIDSVSGNTDYLNSQNIYVWIVKVKTLGSMDNIVFQFEIGNEVKIKQQ